MSIYKRLCHLTIAFGVSAAAHSQDGQLSQYEAAPVLLNPALTGMYENAEFRMACNVRSQWTSLSSNFLTTAFAYDLSFQKRFGAGMYLTNYNMAGIVNTFQAGASGAYNVFDPKGHHTLSAGVQLGLVYKKINDQQLVWDAQYSNGNFDSDLPSGENLQRGARLMPDVSLGIAYRSTSPRAAVKPFANVALFHVTTPDESILRSTKSDLPIRYSINAGLRVNINEQFVLIPQALGMRQGADQQIHAGMLAEFVIGGSVYSALCGASYRVDDAVVAHVGLKHKNSAYRFSYDVNTSPLRSYSRSNGAFEFSIVYYGTHAGRERRLVSNAF
ncbi:MAG: PorP/SprF family type IX secretion system membrane protein [Flavobacteriales bacterium]|nr:MAG: PorP/SprF family type IX secretion system membrane protein [Flavobacteriales bacterium]